jgi:hypothetical protein
MIVATAEDANGNRIVSEIRPGFAEVEVGEFNWDCGEPVFYAYPHFPFNKDNLESVLNMMKWL